MRRSAAIQTFDNKEPPQVYVKAMYTTGRISNQPGTQRLHCAHPNMCIVQDIGQKVGAVVPFSETQTSKHLAFKLNLDHMVALVQAWRSIFENGTPS